MPSDDDRDEQTLVVEDETLARGFTQIPNYILRARNLSRDAKLLWGILLSYAWQSGACFPGYDRLTDDLQCGRSQLSKWIQELKQGGYIDVRRRGQGKTNVYTLKRFQTTENETSRNPAPVVSLSRRQEVTTSRRKEYSAEKDSEEVDPLAIRLCALLHACKPDDRAEVRAHLAELGNGERVGRAIGRAEMEWDRRQGPREFWRRVEWWLENGG